MATYAVGDLQGCLDELQQLLDKIAFGADDRLWLTGDLVNRGPRSLDTLRFVKQLGDQVDIVQGNHDLHLLAVASGCKGAGRKDTFDKILAAADRDELMNWLQQIPLLHQDQINGQPFVMVHAGIPPIWDIPTAVACAAEVEAVLRSERASEYFNAMYGNSPSRWDPSIDGMARYRLITNYLTRMRFCRADGELELETKTGPNQPPAGFAPWFSYPRKDSTRLFLATGPRWKGVPITRRSTPSTPVVSGAGHLTALRLDDGQLFSVPAIQQRNG